MSPSRGGSSWLRDLRTWQSHPARLNSGCLLLTLVPPTPLLVQEEGVCGGIHAESAPSSAGPEKSVCGSPRPILAPIPGRDSARPGAFIKFLFFNYTLIVTNPNKPGGGGPGLRPLSLPETPPAVAGGAGLRDPGAKPPGPVRPPALADPASLGNLLDFPVPQFLLLKHGMRRFISCAHCRD